MKIGIIGTGRIAKRFVKEAAFVSDADISAVYNPHEGSAERFIDELWGENSEFKGKELPPAYMEFEEFLNTVDAVYIASVHETHYEYAKKALEHGKHVLCEKPMSLKCAEIETLYSIADEKGLVLMEGLKSAYCPGYKKLLEIALSGVIGEIKYIDACFTKLENTSFRELTDKQYGGSFTELGSYVMLPVFSLFGTDHMTVDLHSIKNERTGLDFFTKGEFVFDNGTGSVASLASGTVGLGVKSEGRLLISGTGGYIVVNAPWWKTSHFEVHFEDPSKVITYDEPFEGDGLRYELEYFFDSAAGKADGSYNEKMRKISCKMAECMEKFLEGRKGKGE